MVFCILSDSAYAYLAIENIKHIKALHPDERILLYDIGLKGYDRRRIERLSANLRIVPWPIGEVLETPNRTHNLPLQDATRIALFHASRLRGPMRKLTRFALRHFPRSWLARRAMADYDRWENKVARKVECARDAARKCGSETIVLLDADAILIKPIDIILEPEFDFAVTMLTPEEVAEHGEEFGTLRGGIVIFGPDRKARDALLNHWWEQCLEADRHFTEEAALERIFSRLARQISGPWQQAMISIGEIPVRIQTLPVSRYNYHDIRNIESADKSDIRVLHFTHKYKNPRIFYPLLQSAAGWHTDSP